MAEYKLVTNAMIFIHDFVFRPVLTTKIQCNLQLTLLSVAGVSLQTISWVLEGFPVLRTLNLTKTGLDSLPEVGFQPLPHLETLDLRGCPLTTFYPGVFEGLVELKQLYADNIWTQTDARVGRIAGMLCLD
jgi:hypothetical protein